MLKKYYKVKTGYHIDDYISVEEDEVAMCMKAQVTGKIATTRAGSVAGNIILSITPDYNRMLGLSRDYRMSYEDYSNLGNARKETEFLLEYSRECVKCELNGLPPPKKPNILGNLPEERRKLAEGMKAS